MLECFFPVVGEMFHTALDHVLHKTPAMHLEVSEEHSPLFARVLHAHGCPKNHCFAFIRSDAYNSKLMEGQEAIHQGRK